MIEKSFAENTLRNCRHALQKFDEWLQGRPISDGLLAEYITHLHNEGKAPETISVVVTAVRWFLKHGNGGKPVELPLRPRHYRVSTGKARTGNAGNTMV